MSEVEDLELQLKREKAMHRMAYQHAMRTDAELAKVEEREARTLAEVAHWKAKCAEMAAREAELLAVLDLDPLTKWDEILAMVKTLADKPE
jgi:hypothetical protein